jgi:hypothetical protein
MEHNPRSWILEGLEPNANRLKMVDGNGRGRHRFEQVASIKEPLATKSVVEGV